MNSLPLPESILGERLRRARSNANLTQDAVASELGISRTTLVAIEKGQRRVRPDELLQLGRLYKVQVGRLSAPDAIHVDLSAKFRRTEGREPGPEVAESIAVLNRLATGAAELERITGVELRRDYPPAIRIKPQGLHQQAEDAATSLRQRLGVGLGRIDDLFSLFELELGIRVFNRPLAGSVSGLYAFDPAIGACVLINSLHPRKRRIQSLAHEVGHFVSDRSHADVLDDQPVSHSIEERFARRFGPALLMPAGAVRSRFDDVIESEQGFSIRQLVLLAHQFGVATEAMARRLEELDLLPSGTWESMKDRKFNTRMERSVLGDPEPEHRPPMVPPRLAFLAAVAAERELLTEGQLCDLLVVDRLELRASLAVFAVGSGGD